MGCGVGGPARHIALFSDAKVTGLNINDYQIFRARELTKSAGLEHLCDFVKVSNHVSERVFHKNTIYAQFRRNIIA